MTLAARGSNAVWAPESGSSRGTVLLLPGRGEHPGVYRRLGRRLAADGYTLVAVDRRDAEPDDVALAALFAEHDAGTRVLLGADTGALLAWSLAAGGVAGGAQLDALVLAGLPLEPGAPALSRDDELAARTACPVHRALLTDDPTFGWGALDAAPGAALAALPALPTLILHGEADPIAPVDPVRRLAATGPDVRLAVVGDGVHDVLNDQFHRSVAARLVLFLEEIGKGAVLTSAPGKPLRARRAAPLHVSARLDYALRAIAELAGAGADPVRCESIARARSVPLNSLVNLMVGLRRAGLVRSQRGCEGGYWLARPASAITVAEVVRAVEGEIVSLHTDGPDSWLWHQLGQTVAELLEGWTVEDVASRPRKARTL